MATESAETKAALPTLLLIEEEAERERYRTALAEHDVPVQFCEDVRDFAALVAAGAAVGVVTRAAIPGDPGALFEQLARERQAPTPMPVFLLVDPADREEMGGAAAHVTVVETPVKPRNLASLVQFALRIEAAAAGRRYERADRAKSARRMHSATSQLGRRVREQSEMLDLMRDIASAANLADSVEEALSFALRRICQHNGWAFGHAYLPDPYDRNVLRPVDVYYEDAPDRFREFRAVTLEGEYVRGRGLPGRVFASGKPEWTRGVERELGPVRAKLATDLGIAQMAAFPIMTGTEVVGVLEIFSEEISDLELELLDAMASVGTQLGRVIERAEAERSLRESYRIIERISDTGPVMMRVYDQETHHYVFVNKRMAEFIGRSAEEIVAASADDFLGRVHAEDVERVREVKRNLPAYGRDTTLTWQGRLRRADGAWRWVRTWSALFSAFEGEEPQHVLSVSIDVTDQVVAEERLHQTERLTSIGTLAAGIAHEVNNPLASVIMTGQLLQKRDLDENSKQMIANLIEDAKRCGRIVRSVQQFAREDASERGLLDLRSVVEAAQNLCQAELRKHEIQLETDVEDELPKIHGDLTELEQVLINLVVNAAHASEPGQKVVLRLRRAEYGVELLVEDRGHGMSDDVKRRVFDPFFTTRGREGGTGLGLSVAHGIVRDHGGTIDVHSEVGAGTTIVIWLPAGGES